jgi:hypothetical protein
VLGIVMALGVAALAAGCEARQTITTLPTPALTCDVEEVVDGPGQAAVLHPVVSAGTGAAAATVLAGRSVSEAASTVLVICTQASDGMDQIAQVGSTSVGPAGNASLTSDLGQSDDLMSARAGRVSSDVALVELALVSGAVVTAVVAEGYWLAVWQGRAQAERIVALDGAGKTIGSIEL